MATSYGLLTVFDSDREFVNTKGQRIVLDAIREVVARYNAEIRARTGLFVSGLTEDHKFRYKLPGGGHMQRMNTQGRPAAVKARGEWDVAFPLEGFGDAIADNRIDMAYMTAGDLERHLSSIFIRGTNTYRFEMIKALVNNVQDSFVDARKGTLLVEPLANGDAVVYPPVIGSETEATEDHYLASGGAAVANDDFQAIVDDLEQHFGAGTGGENILVICNNAESAAIKALSDFVEVPDRFIRVGDTTDVPFGLPMAPGRILGRHKAGCWVAEWRWWPAAYLYGTHLESAPPLMERHDEAVSGLPSGLNLVAEDSAYPLQESFWEWRFGLGASNRLNGVVMEITAGAFSIPTGYT